MYSKVEYHKINHHNNTLINKRCLKYLWPGFCNINLQLLQQEILSINTQFFFVLIYFIEILTSNLL